MNQPLEPAAQQTRISTLDDVAELFMTGSLGLRSSLLHMIVSQPEKALRYREVERVLTSPTCCLER